MYCRATVAVFAVLVALAWLTACQLDGGARAVAAPKLDFPDSEGEDAGKDGDAPEDLPLGKKSTRPGSAKDPADAAFALPKGVKLNDKQQKEYDRLKKEKGPLLRSAMDQVQTGSSAEKTKAIKDVQKLRSDIKLGIQQIVAMPYIEAKQKANAEASKKRADARKHKKNPPKKHRR